MLLTTELFTEPYFRWGQQQFCLSKMVKPWTVFSIPSMNVDELSQILIQLFFECENHRSTVIGNTNIISRVPCASSAQRAQADFRK